MKGIFKDSSILYKIFQLIIVFMISSLLGITIGAFLANIEMSDLSSMRTLQLTYTVFCFLIPPFVLAWLWSEQPFKFLHLTQKVNWKSALLVVLFMIVAIPFINLLADLNQRIVLPEFLSNFEEQMKMMEEQAALQTERLLEAHSIGGLLFNIFLVAIIPALGEELFFRGTIQKLFQEWKGKVFAIWIAAFIFSIIHFQFYGFIPRMLIGALFGYLLVWSNTLWIPILAHFTNNAIVVIFYYLKNNGYKLIDIDTIGSGDTWWIGLLSGILCIAGIFIMKKKLSKQTI